MLKFESLLGHKKSLAILEKIIKSSRIPHAFLFTGADGIGKKIAAALTAAAMNCEGSGPDPCGICSSCMKLTRGSHPLIKLVRPAAEGDYAEIGPAGEKVIISNVYPSSGSHRKSSRMISIDQIRQIIHESTLKPYGGGKKVFIIDDAAFASLDAQNCLLKVLEEPPENTFFILVSSREDMLLPTIVSRCQKIEFSPLSDEDMRKFLEKYHEGEIGDVEKIIRQASGSPAKFLSYADMEECRFEKTSPAVFFSAVSSWYDDMADCRKKLETMLEREGMKFREEPDDKRLEVVSIIEETLGSVKRNANPDLALSNMFLKLGFMEGLSGWQR